MGGHHPNHARLGPSCRGTWRRAQRPAFLQAADAWVLWALEGGASEGRGVSRREEQATQRPRAGISKEAARQAGRLVEEV